MELFTPTSKSTKPQEFLHVSFSLLLFFPLLTHHSCFVKLDDKLFVVKSREQCEQADNGVQDDDIYKGQYGRALSLIGGFSDG